MIVYVKRCYKLVVKKTIIIIALIALLVFSSTTAFANSPDYLNRSVNEVIYPEYTFTHIAITGTLNPSVDDSVSIGEPALRFKNAYYSGTVRANDFNGTTYWDQLAGVPAGLADGDNDTQLTEADITAMGFTKDYDTNETVRVDALYANVSKWDAAYGWGDHHLMGYLTAETDPLYSTSAASIITGSDINNWNAAYGWGDHHAEGYLKAADLVPAVGNWSADKPSYVNYSSLSSYTAGWDTNASDDLTTAGGVIQGSLVVNGNLTVIGSYVSAQVTNVNITGDLNPSLNNTFKLGTSSKKWSDIYANRLHGQLEWSEVNNRPTDLGQFTNNPGFIYSAQTINWDKNASDDFSGSWNDLTNVPAGLADGDNDTHLTASEVVSMVGNWSADKNSYVNYSSLSSYTAGWDTNASDDFSGDFNDLTNVPPGLANGDDDCSVYGSCGELIYDQDTSAWDKNKYDDFSGSWNDLTNVPSDIADGDGDYCANGACQGSLFIPGNLTIAGSYINAQVTNANITGTLFPSVDYAFDLGGNNNHWRVVYADSFSGDLDFGYLTNVPPGLADGDNDTHLTASEVVSMVGNWSSDKPLYVTHSELNYTTDTNCAVYGSCGELIYDQDTSAWDKNKYDDFSGDYNDLINKPTNLSQFVNDLNNSFTDTHANVTEIAAMGFITLTQVPPDTNETVRVDALYANVSKWDAAYGWGDHHLMGYLTAETDPSWTAAKNNYYNKTEVDDLVNSITINASTTANITLADVNNWNYAYDWVINNSNSTVNVSLNNYYNKTVVDQLLINNSYNDSLVNDRLGALENLVNNNVSGFNLQLHQGWNNFKIPPVILVGSAFVNGLNVTDYNVTTILSDINGSYDYLAYYDGSSWQTFIPGNSSASTFNEFPHSASDPDYEYYVFMNASGTVSLSVV